MIVELSVENLAIIERSHLALGPGFTVLTGETGAGKSLLIDAIELALGERADSELVRAGAARATVQVVFDLSTHPELIEKCGELGVVVEDATLYIHREVFAEGRSQCRIGGKLTPVSVLRQLGQVLVDLHGQHDHQSLMDPLTHVGFLDGWIGTPARDLLSRVQVHAEKVSDIQRRLASLRTNQRDREHKLDLLRFQINEIEALCPVAGEFEELEAQLSRLKNVEKLVQATSTALSGLHDEEGSADEALGSAIKALSDGARFDPSLEPIVEVLEAALVNLQDGVHRLRTYSDEIEADPDRLEALAERLDGLRRLRKKYGADEAEILGFLQNAQEELALLEDSEASEEGLALELEKAEAELVAVCSQLTALRKERASEFAGLVQAQLRDLAMDRAVFEVSIQAKEPSSDGADQVEFFFSANAGEPPRPLGKIASGGEISRVMLAVKTALAGRAGVPTLIFDEVDAGLGGRAAAVVAKKIEELAAHYQVVVISHLPQIASRATTHHRIQKGENQGRVTTQVVELTSDERVEEIARMLAGEQVTESALANAREMLSGKIPATAR